MTFEVAVTLIAIIAGAAILLMALFGGGNGDDPVALCPGCCLDLVRNPSTIVRDGGADKVGEVAFLCSCGRYSRWSFAGDTPALLSSSRLVPTA